MTSVITSFGVNIEWTGRDSTRWEVNFHSTGVIESSEIHSSTSEISSLHGWSELFTRFFFREYSVTSLPKPCMEVFPCIIVLSCVLCCIVRSCLRLCIFVTCGLCIPVKKYYLLFSYFFIFSSRSVKLSFMAPCTHKSYTSIVFLANPSIFFTDLIIILFQYHIQVKNYVNLATVKSIVYCCMKKRTLYFIYVLSIIK